MGIQHALRRKTTHLNYSCITPFSYSIYDIATMSAEFPSTTFVPTRATRFTLP